MTEVLGSIFIFLCYVVINMVIYDGVIYPKFEKRVKKSAFLIEKGNYSEKQGKVECSGYASAYVYRHLGKNVSGAELYKEMPCKNKKGLVYCKGIVKLAKKYGFRAKLRTGNVTTLKNTIAKGIPVIVLLRIRISSTALHYVPVVGYDENNFYVVDSMTHLRNEETTYYNRKIPMDEFRKLWNTSQQVLFFNLFFEITK